MEQKVPITSKMKVYSSVVARVLLYAGISSQVLLWHYSQGFEHSNGTYFLFYYEKTAHKKLSSECLWLYLFRVTGTLIRWQCTMVWKLLLEEGQHMSKCLASISFTWSSISMQCHHLPFLNFFCVLHRKKDLTFFHALSTLMFM